MINSSVLQIKGQKENISYFPFSFRCENMQWDSLWYIFNFTLPLVFSPFRISQEPRLWKLTGVPRKIRLSVGSITV